MEIKILKESDFALCFPLSNTSLIFFFTLKSLISLKLNPNHAFSQSRSEQVIKYQDPLCLSGNAVYLMLFRTEKLGITM